MVVVEPDCSIIHLGPKSLTVADLYSVSDRLDHNVVSFQYERSSTLVCSITLTSEGSHLPAHGQLVTGGSEGTGRSSGGEEINTEAQNLQEDHLACSFERFHTNNKSI